MEQSILEKLTSSTENCDFRIGEPMAAHTTFRIGGRTALFCLPGTPEALLKLMDACRRESVRYMIVGRGSNLLFSDRGFDGAVISTAAMDRITMEGTHVRAQCGAALSRLSCVTAEAGLAGLEFAHGIPGSLGGAVYMNAGAYGGEMSGVVESARVLFCDRIEEVSAEELRFGYRHSALQENGGIVLSADLRLKNGNREESIGLIRDLDARRREKQPLDRGSAGSFFKRPAVGFAGALIEQAGLKGACIGGAQVSPKHAGFIVNNGNATCEDVLKLKDLVVRTVREKSGVTLEMEVRLAGDL